MSRAVDSLQFSVELQESGFYEPKYKFQTANDYGDRLEAIREQQKALIKDDRAIVCPTEWSVGGSKAEGKKMIKRLVKLGLSAFNVQADNVILTVTYKNIDRCEDRIAKVRENVEKLLEVNNCRVTTEFFSLKIQELHLAFEYEEKLQAEKEEQKKIRLQMQEEERVRREIEKAQAEAEKQESMYELALEKAKNELEKKTEGQRQEWMEKISDLEKKLQEAHEKKERALSQAQLTKRGHVYIISNIGSFGEQVFKIGMTRRLDPMDRVDELGDASVPFDFDVHAMIFSEDAPSLESTLHEKFDTRRINKVNERKEFFKVNIDEIEEICLVMGLKIQLTKIAEAKEYRQTLGMEKSDKKSA